MTFVRVAHLQKSWQVQYFGDIAVQISQQAHYFVDLEVQISWQAQYFVNLEVRISLQAQRCQHFVNLEVQISWQAQRFVHLDSLDLKTCRSHSALSGACSQMCSRISQMKNRQVIC